MAEKREKWGISFEVPNCPKCREKQPIIRIPTSLKQLMWGGHTCNNCGCEMDKYGKEIDK